LQMLASKHLYKGLKVPYKIYLKGGLYKEDLQIRQGLKRI
jgi:hypothetical protein